MPKANGNKLVAVVFDDPYTAEEARAALHRMGGEGLLEIDETALIAKYADGRTRVSQDVNIAANGEKVGHIAGLLTAAVTGTLPFIMAGTLGGWLGRQAHRPWHHELLHRQGEKGGGPGQVGPHRVRALG